MTFGNGNGRIATAARFVAGIVGAVTLIAFLWTSFSYLTETRHLAMAAHERIDNQEDHMVQRINRMENRLVAEIRRLQDRLNQPRGPMGD